MSKLFRFFLLLTGLLLGQQRPGAAQVFEWASVARKTATGTFSATASATDAAGNTYASVAFPNQLQVGTQTLTGPATALIKYSPTGQVLWTQTLTGQVVEQIAIDAANGGFFASGQVPAGPIGSAVPHFYAKYSAAGVQQWTQALPAIVEYPTSLYNRFEYDLKLTADDQGNCYLLGTLATAGTVGGVALDNRTMFLLQANASGAAQWVRQFHGDAASLQWTGPGGLLNAGLAPKPGGGCLVFGQILGVFYFGPGTTAPSLTSIGSRRDAILANIDANGTLRWTQRANGAAINGRDAYFNAAAADAAGNCYVTGGGGYGSMSFGTSSITRGFALAKYDATGTLQWLSGQQPSTNAYAQGVQLVVDAPGSSITVAVQDSSAYRLNYAPAALGTLRLPAAYNLVRYDGAGQPQWVVGETRPADRDAPYFAPVGLSRDGADNLYWSGTPRTWRPVPLTHATVLGAQTASGDGLIVSRLSTQANTLLGAVYHDVNGNGQQDAGETAYAKPLMAQVTQNGADAFYPSQTDGELQAFASAGTYNLQLAPGGIPRYYTVTQPAAGSYTGSFGGSNQVQTGKVFGLGPIANQPDVRVTLTPYGVARVGTLLRYRVTLENVGTTTATGTLTSSLDSRAQYVGSTPAGTTNGPTISWNYANLAPQATQTFDVQYSLPINLAVGTVLTYTATATLPGELTPADNSATEQQTVVSSFDPNDISVNYSQLTEQQITARQPLDYTVRFQNMGTDTAFAVVIQDTLDVTRLQAGTLEMIAQSHNCSWLLSRQGTLTLRLLNAKLPPRSTNVLGSQGFIRFRVRPLGTLTPGAVIPNHAHITFDYNAPLRTNTATTTVLLPTATRPGQVALSWDAYPNPVTDALTITLPAGTAATAELLDALGRPVRQQPLTSPAPTLDLRTLPAGVYRLRLRTPQGYTTGRSIVRQ